LRAAALALLALLLPQTVLADGGAIRLKQTAPPFAVTVFSPEPLRAGEVDLSLLLQSATDGAAILDATVDFVLTPPGAATPLHARATRAAATNKLLLAALVDLRPAGTWDLRVEIQRGDERAAVSGVLVVGEAAARREGLWPYLALPPAVILLFGLGQWLTARRAPQRPKRSQ